MNNLIYKEKHIIFKVMFLEISKILKTAGSSVEDATFFKTYCDHNTGTFAAYSSFK